MHRPVETAGLQIVLNYEEGGQSCVLHGDPASESFLSEIIGADAFEGMRHKSMESIYEYGSRAGVWRLLRLFEERKLPVTVFGVGMALARNPEAVAAMVAGGHEAGSRLRTHGVPEGGARRGRLRQRSPAARESHPHAGISGSATGG